MTISINKTTPVKHNIPFDGRIKTIVMRNDNASSVKHNIKNRWHSKRSDDTLIIILYSKSITAYRYINVLQQESENRISASPCMKSVVLSSLTICVLYGIRLLLY